MRAVCAEAAPARRVGRRPGLLRRPGELRPGRPRRRRTTLLREQVADQVGHAARASRRRRARGARTSSRTARSTTGWSTTRSRRGPCWPGPGRCRCSGMPGGAAPRPGRGGRAGSRSLEGFPDRGYAADGRLRAARPAGRACSPTPTQIAAPGGRAGRRGRLGLRARRHPGRGGARGRRPGRAGGRGLRCAGRRPPD